MADGLTHSRTCALSTVPAQITGTHTGLPVLFTAANLPAEMFDADGAAPAQNGGGDIRFTSDEAGTVDLPCEVVSFVTDNNPANGAAEIWAKLPNVRASQVDTIHVWWSTSGTDSQPAVGAANGRNAVWSNYYLVLHAETAHLVDSTGNNPDFSAAGAASIVSAGALGNGVEFTGSEEYFSGPGSFAFSGHPLTIQVAGRRGEEYRQVLLGWGDGDTFGAQTYIGFLGTTNVSMIFGEGTSVPVFVPSGSGVPEGPFFMNLAFDPSDNYSANYWYDGTLYTRTGTHSFSAAAWNRFALGVTGDMSPTYYAKSIIGEARIAKTALGDDWVATEVANWTDQASFVSAGTPEDVGGGATEVAVSAAVHAQVADTAPLTQWHVLTAAGSLHGHLAGMAGLDGVASLAPAHAGHAQVAGMAVATQGHVLAVAGIHHADMAADASLAQQHLLAALAATHAHFATASLLTLASDGAPAARTQRLAAHAGRLSIPADSRSRRAGAGNRTLSITTSR